MEKVKQFRRRFGDSPSRKIGLRGSSGRLLRAYRGNGDENGVACSVRADAYDRIDEARFCNRLSDNGRHTVIVDTKDDDFPLI